MPDKPPFKTRLIWSLITAFGVGAWILTGSRAMTADAIEEPPFSFFQEFHGSGGYKDPQSQLNLQQGLMNGVTLWPPLEPGATNLIHGAGRMILRLAGAQDVAGLSPEGIEGHLSAFARLALTVPGVQLFWNLMPEWDQSGGDWVALGRPSYAGLSRPDAYARFLRHYEIAHPSLMEQLRRQASSVRPFQLAAITDHSPNVFYAYELGADLQMLERGIDELGDLSTGIAYLRGAARQANKSWGIDISSWRSSTNGATAFDDSGRLESGWSASYLSRIYYLSFAAGAHVIHNEAVTYRNANGSLNPYGEATREFADFALRRHPDIGKPTVNIAFLLDHFAGFDPKHGIHNQVSAVWYQDLAYSDGDFMIDNLLRAAYPGHWLHGLAPGAPFADSRGVPNTAAFVRFLAAGGDPRPYEPMPTTLWGDNTDVISSKATPESLSRYRAIFLAGDVTIGETLRQTLYAWVTSGGVLVLNAAQGGETVEELAGVEIASRTPKTASGWRWISNLGVQPEEPFSYLAVRPRNAEVLALSQTGDPIVTKRALGRGEVILTTPLFLQTVSRNRLLGAGTQLLDRLVRRFEPVQVLGKPIEYVVGRPAGKVVVTLANHSSSVWDGRVIAPIDRGGAPTVTEYLSDRPIAAILSEGQFTIPVQVPPFAVRVVAIEYAQ